MSYQFGLTWPLSMMGGTDPLIKIEIGNFFSNFITWIVKIKKCYQIFLEMHLYIFIEKFRDASKKIYMINSQMHLRKDS